MLIKDLRAGERGEKELAEFQIDNDEAAMGASLEAREVKIECFGTTEDSRETKVEGGKRREREI